MCSWSNTIPLIFLILSIFCVDIMSALHSSTNNNSSEYDNYIDTLNQTLVNTETEFNNVLKNFSSDERGLDEGRGWKKIALPFLLGITLKMTTLLPMITSLMTIIGGVSLLASKIALFLSVGLAVHYYLVTKHQQQLQKQQLAAALYDTLPASPYPVTHRLSVQSN